MVICHIFHSLDIFELIDLDDNKSITFEEFAKAAPRVLVNISKIKLSILKHNLSIEWLPRG